MRNYTAYRQQLVSKDEARLAIELGHHKRYEPLTAINFPVVLQEPGVAYPSSNTGRNEKYLNAKKTIYELPGD